MVFVRSHFGKMQLWIVEHVFIHRKVTVVMNHKIQFFKCFDSLVQVPFSEEKSVQLFRVAFFWRDFFQNPYLKVSFQGVVAFGGHFATLCLEVDNYKAFFPHYQLW